MDTKSPHFWRTVNSVGTAILALAFLILFLGAKANSEFWVFTGLYGLFPGFVILIVSRLELYHAENRVIDETYEQHQETSTKVKIRCASCAALNDEANNFCGQCGQAL